MDLAGPVSQTQVSDAQGQAHFLNLPVGTYTVRVSANQRSTKLRHKLLVGMKCSWKRGWRASQAAGGRAPMGAVAALHAAIALDPTNPQPYVYLGILAAQAGGTRGAETLEKRKDSGCKTPKIWIASSIPRKTLNTEVSMSSVRNRAMMAGADDVQFQAVGVRVDPWIISDCLMYHKRYACVHRHGSSVRISYQEDQ